ncbi:MAG: hypothetical protein AB1411_14280 [Nitrospirota bacterium]
MKPASEPAAESEVIRVGQSSAIPLDPAYESLLTRLEALSLEPGFRLQRELALGRALRPYVEYARRLPIAPLPEEVALATLYLYADFFPEDGQLDLIEQLRDVIETHVPQEERDWLDPLHHSYMDLLEIRAIGPEGGLLALRSLGDGKEFDVPAGAFSRSVAPGQVLLTRLLRRPALTLFAGPSVVLSAANARTVLETTQDWRREMEAAAGSFELGEWEEFAKRYGYMLMWQVAQARLGLLIQSETGIRYATAKGEPLLYALAFYEHHEPRFLADGLGGMKDCQPEAAEAGRPKSWVQRDAGGAVVARLVLTRTQLFVECDSSERLDGLKHRLASTFGFSLRFLGESAALPAHEFRWEAVDLTKDGPPTRSVVVPVEEEHRLLSAFLDSAYLEWADRPSPALGSHTPRHAAASPATRDLVAGLIAQMERDDPASRRTGKPGYDYNRLRAHVGLPEVRP